MYLKLWLTQKMNITKVICSAGFLETLSAVPDTEVFNARKPFHFYLLNGLRQKMVLFEGRFERPEKYEQADGSEDHVGQKVETNYEPEDPLQYPGGSAGNKPLLPNQGNSKPQKPNSKKPLQHELYETNVHYSDDKFGIQPDPTSYNYQPQPRPHVEPSYSSQQHYGQGRRDNSYSG